MSGGVWVTWFGDYWECPDCHAKHTPAKPEDEHPCRCEPLTEAEQKTMSPGPCDGCGKLPPCCASSHDPPDTACKSFLAGSNTRCVYCDHEEKCHPGPGATCWIGSGENGEQPQ
jgi:hypothetical protein